MLMSRFLKRLEKNIQRYEKRIEKEEMRIVTLHEKCDNKKITRAEFNLKKREIETRIKALNSRIRSLQGMGVKEKQHLEEKEEEKIKKKEEKEKKKKSKKEEK